MSSGREALERFAPAAAEAITAAVGQSSVDPGTTAALRSACAAAVDLRPLPVASDADAADEPAGLAAVTAMAEQFAVDVSAVDDDLRARFTAACGQSTFGAAQALYVADMVPRLRALLDAVFGATDEWDDDAAVATVDDGTMWATLDALMREVHTLNGLDPVLAEVVRLDGARAHNCRLCRSLRSRPALLAGASEQLFDAIDTPGRAQLDATTRTALDVTDAMIWHPARIDPELVARVSGFFSAAQVVELALDVVRNAANKIAVALAADAAHVTEGVEIYEVDEHGVAHYGLSVT